MIRKYMLAAAIFLCYIHGSDNKDVFSGPTSKLSKYTVVNPQLIHRGVRSINGLQSSEESDGKDTLTYSLNITKRKHLLHLKRNKDFLSKDFVQYSHDASGKYTSTHPKQHGNCYYHGHVEGQEDSLVALSTCSGLRGVIFIGREIYGLEPVPQSNEHILYLLSDVQSELVVCGVANETTESHSPFDPGHSVTERRKRNLPDTSYVELALVVDNLRYTFKKRNETAVREEMVELANLLDAYYKQLNIRVVLVGLEVFKDDNPFSVVGSAGEVLERFVKWRKTSLLPRIRNDVGQLIVGRPGPYGGAVLGMAFVGTVCSVASSGGINVFSDNSLPYFSTVVAHEMGHNLGMNHDDERCSCDGGSCIMSASASGTTKFSTCSGQDFERLVRRGGGVCLKNQPSPSDVEGVAKCGNGMLEEGEQCDCGTPEECKNKCCDAATCTLTPGAACGQGECCSNCQVRVAGTPCRGSSNTCDLPEYCNGTNPFCPDDFYVMDGLPCENDAAYCYGGRCQTYGYQCRHLFEEDAVKAADICFQHANTQGNIFGNCGRDSSGNLIKCSVANAMCGKVQCTNVDVNRPPPGAHVSIQIIQGSSCVNADFNLGSDDVLDPAYVNPGSPCGKGKVCLDFNCVNASALLPNLNCDAQRTCNGRGLCNDRGHCHCNDGRAPPFCRWSGRGGSVDSGPAQIDYSLRDGLLIFFLLVVPVVTFLILLLLYIFKRDSLERCLKRSLRRSRNAENGHSNGQTNGNAQTTTQRPMQDLPAKPHGNPPDFSAPAPGYRYGELDYWNTDSKAPTPPSAPSSQPPVIITQGPRVPKPFPPKQEPH